MNTAGWPWCGGRVGSSRAVMARTSPRTRAQDVASLSRQASDAGAAGAHSPAAPGPTRRRWCDLVERGGDGVAVDREAAARRRGTKDDAHGLGVRAMAAILSAKRTWLSSCGW